MPVSESPGWLWLTPGWAWPFAAVCIGVPLLALALDWLVGEPPAAWHPVVWMGRALQACGERLAPSQPVAQDLKRFWLAALVWCALAAIVLIVSSLAQHLVLRLHELLAAALLAALLKPLMAWRMLRDEVLAVEVALGQSLPAGREQLARLVSRDVSQLTADQVRESAIESLAENLNDSVVAPLFWFVLLGLPGAALYRFANTADAMWGYPGMRGGRYWQWAGKWAARADDVLSWLPARITALLLALSAGGVQLRSLVRQARKTPSPNSGWPMAAMALALNVRLAKPGVYTLHGNGRRASPLDTRRAARLCGHAVLWLVPLLAGLQLLILVVFAWLQV
ncbi:adenosylcobinamide-phosphate synthase CbiB [Acidovorax sp.]|uniref:adenosylcobinamide-phosphate synthase CbiB n=1 Tax=Acidovorax sp. TaxID=1872122 RepID=UPI00391CEC06